MKIKNIKFVTDHVSRQCEISGSMKILYVLILMFLDRRRKTFSDRMVADMSMMITSENDTALLNKSQGWASLYKFLTIRHIEVVSIVHYLLFLYNIRFTALSIICHTPLSMHTLGQSYVNL
jgi:hypothetical protein